MRKIYCYLPILFLLLNTYTAWSSNCPTAESATMMDPLVVSLLCPATPGMDGMESESTMVLVGTTDATGAGSITFPSGIYSTIPPEAVNINVSLETTLESFGASWLSEIIINIDAPGTFADAVNYQPSMTNGSGPESYTLDYGDNDPTGTWDFSLFDTSNDTGTDAEVTFLVTLSWTVPAIPSDCDSIVCDANSLVLDTQLPGMTYQWSTMETSQSITVTESGTYAVTVTDTNGDTATDDVTVTFGTSEMTQDINICDGETYEIGTSSYNMTGVYTDIFESYTGCDSTIITNLTVGDLGMTEDFPIICDGETYTIGTSTYNTSGDYTDVLQSSQGCDSTVVTHLTVLDAITTTDEVSICDGGSHTVGTSTYTMSGTYTDVLTSYLNCDSTVTTILSVVDNIIGNQDVVICFGESYEVGTSTYTMSGNYTDVLQSVAGCDSTVNTNLTVLDELMSENTLILCFGESHEVGMNTYTESGIYTDILESYDGCDSTVTTDLTILEENLEETFIQICDGQSHDVGDNSYTMTGDYTDILESYQGCDSTIITHLTVLDFIETTDEVSICDGESHEVGTSTYTMSGTYTDILESYQGCDSTVQTILIVNDNPVINEDVVICFGESYEVGTSTYTMSGNYTDVLQSVAGCDSTVNTNLTVLDELMSENTLILCFGESHEVGMNTYTESGIYTDILESYDGCDSTVTTDLTILEENLEETFIQICDGQSHDVGDNSYTMTGDYTDILESYEGCDSTIITHLNVVNQIEEETFIMICEGDVHPVGDSLYTETGDYINTLESTAGCDSIITTHLTVALHVTEENFPVLCFGDTLFIGDNSYTTSGTYTDLLETYQGCDSTIISNLTILDENIMENDVEICAGESIEIGMNSYDVSGDYTDTLESYLGCDSTIITHLTVLGEIETIIDAEICPGQEYVVGTSVYETPGTYTGVLEAVSGCDSTVMLTLSLSPPIETENNVQICDGQSYEEGTSSYTVSGTYTDLYTTPEGCDSTVITILNVVPQIEVTNEVAICDGETYEIGSSSYDINGTYTDVLLASGGCDSVVTTILMVVTDIITEQDVSICFGDSYEIGNSSYTEAGIYTDILSSIIGCDSIVVTTLTVIGGETYTNDVEICQGDVYTIGNNTYTEVGIYTDVLESSLGCDSTVVTTLDIVDIITTSETVFLCEGEAHEGVVYPASTTLVEEETSVNGCDSIHTTTIIVSLGLEVEVIAQDDICETGEGSVTAAAFGGIQPYEYAWNTSTVTVPYLEDLIAGVYVITVTDANGCTATAQNVVESTPSVSITYEVTNVTCNGDSDGAINVAITSGTAPYLYIWNGPNNFNGDSPNLDNLQGGNYTLIVYDASGCGAGTSITVGEPEVLETEIITAPGLALASTTGGTAPYQYFWSNSATTPSIDNVDTGIYYVTVEDANGCTTTAEGEVEFGVGIPTISHLTELNILPNPNDGRFALEIMADTHLELDVQIFDMTGKQIYANQINGMEILEAVDLQGIGAGTYLLVLDDGENRMVEKILVK